MSAKPTGMLSYEYEPLKRGEMIREGDEYFDSTARRWTPTNYINRKVEGTKYRRPIVMMRLPANEYLRVVQKLEELQSLVNSLSKRKRLKKKSRL